MSYKGYKITKNDRKTGNFNNYTFFGLPIFYSNIIWSWGVLKKRKKTRNQKIPQIYLFFTNNYCPSSTIRDFPHGPLILNS